MSGEQVVQSRPYHFCVVDEADSILIDEARTPLIISRKGWSLSLSDTGGAHVTGRSLTCLSVCLSVSVCVCVCV